jgi:AmmeMemoRadiSam system protein B
MRLMGRIPATREPAVAGSFYPADPRTLDRLVDECLEAASAFGPSAGIPGPSALGGILVPHAGLVYSGAVAAAAWRRLAEEPPATVVMLGTNHRAAWLRGIGAWDAGAWETPLGPVPLDAALAEAIVDLGPPFTADRSAHLDEHSLEVQLPFVRRLLPDALIVPLAVSAGTGSRAVDAGARLGALLAERRAAGGRIALAISTDAAHYPPAWLGRAVNQRLTSPIEVVDATALAAVEAAIVAEGGPGLACGMCGIEPAVLGLAALGAMGVARGHVVGAATSADAGGGEDRTVGYLAAIFRFD